MLLSCFCEVNSLSAVVDLVKGTVYEEYERAYTTKSDGAPYTRRNLVTLSRYPIKGEAPVFSRVHSGTDVAYDYCTASYARSSES